jgi:type II secretory pathway pseudopilin PulG
MDCICNTAVTGVALRLVIVAPMTTPQSKGATMIELAISLTIMGLLLGLTVPRIGDQVDKLAVRGAARDIRTMLAVARARAIGGARPTSVHFHASDTTVVFVRKRDTLQLRPIGQIFDVSLKATRDSTAFGVNGLGISRANLSIVLRRKAAVETVFVSREGRVR